MCHIYCYKSAAYCFNLVCGCIMRSRRSRNCWICSFLYCGERRMDVEKNSSECQKWTVSLEARASGNTQCTVGGHVCSGASCCVWEKSSWRVQMYDGCCSVRWRLKRSPEIRGPIVVVRAGLIKACAGTVSKQQKSDSIKTKSRCWKTSSLMTVVISCLELL